MLTDISNHYSVGMRRPKVETQIASAFTPTEEWNYAHHPYLAFFRDRFYLTCSSGHNNEDDVGQRMVVLSSPDARHWSDAAVIGTPCVPETGVVIPSGVFVTETRLMAYYLQFDYLPEMLQNGHRKMGSAGRINFCHYVTWTEDGEHWSEPMKLPCFGGNMPVQRLMSGRLFSSGGAEQAYSDVPDGIHGWKSVRVFEPGYGNEGNEVRADDDLPGRVSDTYVSLCEGSIIQQDSGRLWLFLRSATPRLWACHSDDEGESWTLPEKTDFTDNRTKFFFGRFPDGRYYYVGTPDPFPPRTRHVLALSTSLDGLNYDKHYLLADAQYKGSYPGIDKNGVYGYPCCLVKEDLLYIAFSINKEQIAVMSLNWKRL